MDTQRSAAEPTWTSTDLGATLTSWTPPGVAGSVIWMSSLAGTVDNPHGGIPICAPWFGKGRGDVEVPQSHGLVRYAPWRKVSESPTEIAWEISGSDLGDIPGADRYPDDMHYQYAVQISQTGSREGASTDASANSNTSTNADADAEPTLTATLTISSPTEDVVVDHAFHTYFAVSDIDDAVIEGLTDEPLRITGYIDEIFFGGASSGQPIRLTDANRTVTVTSAGASDVVVWNPGPELAAQNDRLRDEEWREFVCIEFGNVQRNAVTIPAGGQHTLEMRLAVA